MKKVVITLMINFVCLHFSYAQWCNDEEMYDIYTPLGSPVSTWVTCEEDISWREFLDDYYSSTYPNAEMIIVYDGVSSTRTFNCHGYAWLRVEQGIDRWLGYYSGNTDPDIYMTDGSYTQVPSETFPGKVFWPKSDDHSAITTEQPGWFISKWGLCPLFKHHWDDQPYGTAGLKYYVRNCSVLGNETINFINRTVTSYTPVKSCGDINVQNATVTNNANLSLDAVGEVDVISDFEVQLGSTLEIK
jgi:hypothetical protein